MTYNLVFLKFNNYYNRKIKRYETLAEYLTNYEYYIDDAVRVINYNDGINVTITFNKGEEGNTIGYDYIVAINADTENTIESRWFILEERQTRQGQWILSLRRDLVADFYDKFIKSTVYVEKGWITLNTETIYDINPLVFNYENFTANQIKRGETPIKDTLGCKWIVGYLNKKYAEEDKNIVTHTNLSHAPDIVVTNETDLAYLFKYESKIRRYPTALTVSFNYKDRSTETIYKISVGESSNNISRLSGGRYNISGSLPPDRYGGFAEKYLDRNNYSVMLDYVVTKYSEDWATSKAEWLRVLDLNNKTILVKNTNKTFRCRVTEHPATNTSTYVSSSSNTPIWYNNLIAYLNRVSGMQYTDADDMFLMTIVRSKGLSVELVEIESETYNFKIPESRNRTIGEAFDAFAIPYVDDKPIGLHVEGVTQVEISDYRAAVSVAQEICDIEGVALDLQLLPYFPISEDLISPTVFNEDYDGPRLSDYMITITDEMVDISASVIRGTSNVVKNVIFWLTSTEFTRIIPYTDMNDYSTVDSIKAINQLDMWRLESGDYSSAFEFNMAKNGSVSYFEIDCKYKPYQPYIHVAPGFGGLYGMDYNDTRGLICSNTNYSLPRLTDAWETYEKNNINYMNAFNRQIVNMETQRKYQRQQEWVSAAAGSVAGMASGALAGSMIPGIRPVAGAVVGGATSAAAGAADLYVSEQLYKENKQYAIDQFNMSLENIRALPNTLVAVGAQNPNNKVFTVLSFYSCTDIERQAFEQKLRWSGCTVGVITDDPMEYIDLSRDTYFKGQLINIDMSDAAHEASELANELAKGVIFLAGG